PLQEELANAFAGTSLKPQTFHSLCASLLPQKGEPVDLKSWLDGSQLDYEIIRRLGVPALKMELDWIRDVGISSREEYLMIERRGIGKELRLNADARNKVYDVLEAYQAYLDENKAWDFNSLPVQVAQALAA